MAEPRSQNELFLLLQQRIETELRAEIRAQHRARAGELERATVTPELAALRFEAGASGVAKAAEIVGFTFDLRPEIEQLLHDLTAPAQVESQVTPIERESIGSTRCDVLIAEDSQDGRELWATILEKRGYTVATAGDGPTAIQQTLERQPRVLLLDIHLPGIDGYDVARAVRDRLGGSIYIIAITGYGQTEDRTRALAAGCDHHMVKPVSSDALVRILTRVGVGRMSVTA
jgi:CheY-like chemotaxis protein